MGKIIKFVDPDKPKNLKNINKNLGLGKAKPVNSTSKFDIHKKVKAKTNKDLANAYHEKYLKKKQELEDQIQKNITDNRGPKSKKELAKIQFDIRQVSYNNSTAEEKRNLDIERLIKLGATKPKKFQNYKEIMEEKKAAEKEFSEKLDGMSNEEKKILLSERNRDLKRQKDQREKGDRRFFKQKDDGLKTSGLKVGKFKNGHVKITRHEVNHMS